MKLLLNLLFCMNCFATGFVNSSIEIEEVTTPSNPTSGKYKLYFKNDGSLYSLDSVGSETEIGAGGGGGDFLANGTVPMTGNLDMGAQDIANVQDINFDDGVDAFPVLLLSPTGNNQFGTSRLRLSGEVTIDDFLFVAGGIETEVDFFHSEPTGNIGFYGEGPVPQGAAIADASGGVTIDAEARTAINALLTYLRSRGDIAP